MTLRHMRLALTRAAVTLAAASMLATAAQASDQKSVIELFTSQGCSSCPPADAVLEKLATSPKFIALSMPVDYWDYLGWKDTFAQNAFTKRQQAYSADRGDREVYTPQAVINGRLHANGSSQRDILSAVSQTGSKVTVGIDLRLANPAAAADGKAVTASVAAASGTSGGVILAMSVIGRREVAIGRGENARRKVAYTNIVREIMVLGPWTGAAATHTVPQSLLTDADSVVVMVQTGSTAAPGAILGASQLTIR